MVRTSRFFSALAAFAVAAGGVIATRWFTDDPAMRELIWLAVAAVEGLAVPAAAAPVGTIDATIPPSGKAKAPARRPLPPLERPERPEPATPQPQGPLPRRRPLRPPRDDAP